MSNRNNLMQTLTPTHIKQQRELLKQQELNNFAQTDVNALILHRTLFCDQLLCQLWQQFQLDHAPLTLIAVGGYGRQEMFPLSDLDFLILSEQPNSPEVEQKLRDFIQCLWDCGFDVGASVRTLSECDEQGRADISIATNLLESRYLCGNAENFEKLTALLSQPDFWPRETFFKAKVEEKQQRYQRYNNTSYNLEPDIKYSPGGLRDLHLIYWIALRHSHAITLQEILQAGLLYPEEYELLQNHQQFLFKVRFALHLILKRYDNRLLFDRQVKIAELLGYQGNGNQGVEQMMKRFFQALQTISGLSDVLTKHYREHFLVGRFVLNKSAVQNSRIFLDRHFLLQNNLICLIQENGFITEPDTILDLFYHLTVQPQAEIHSSVLRQLHIALKQQRKPLSELPLAREKFLRVLAQPNAIARAIIPMHQYGVFSAYLPQWQGIEGLMQFDLFHVYTVDEHTMRVLLTLERFLQPESESDYPICHQVFPTIADRTLLYISALFHDIAKGRGGDHAELGAEDVRKFAQQHGFDARETACMEWLVKQHLLMSTVAQRRDIYDPEVVMAFAEEVQNKVRLDLLLCLTVADICATNQTLWNSWKLALFTTLYQSTLKQFAQGMDQLLDNQKTIDENRHQALSMLNPSQQQPIQTLWQRCPDDYFLRNTPKELVWHFELLEKMTQQPLVKISNRFSDGGTEVFVYCQDQPNLFYKVVATIGAKKISIHNAKISTSLDGYVLDTFIVTELNGDLLPFDRRRDLEKSLTTALTQEKLPILSSSSNPKLAHFQVKTDVRFLDTKKAEHTEMELFALDKAGLLAAVSQVFSELHLNIINAKITTVGARAEDFFMLTNAQNKALNETERHQLEVFLLERLG
ncbi:bifunctional uridylyltransferase/uridylyl-removing protein GlnD [Lonepinella sp. BR2271]|uniref:bifunctional uridylyltransferase/uridylyl-removing protein GlnD n=1 Tax=Lonepinella sp. BR2271 TaxID=3434550 RepID=UPI003F6DF2D2